MYSIDTHLALLTVSAPTVAQHILKLTMKMYRATINSCGAPSKLHRQVGCPMSRFMMISDVRC